MVLVGHWVLLVLVKLHVALFHEGNGTHTPPLLLLNKQVNPDLQLKESIQFAP